MARTLNTYVMVGDTIYEPGTPESEVDGKVTAPDVWDGEADETEPDGYDHLKVADLRAEIAKRNEGRDADDAIPADGSKADLIAALELDDENA